MYSSRVLPAPGDDACRGLDGQARAGLPPARPASRTTTCSRSAPAGAASPCTRRERAAAGSPPRRSLASSIDYALRAGAGGRGRRSRHGALRGLPRPARELRQARLDRDDRGGRLARLRTRSSSAARELLAEDGRMLLQAIVIDDRAYEVEKASRSFIRTHIFPDGCLPSLEVIARCRRAAHRPAHRRTRGPHAPLRRDASTLARQLRGRRQRGCRTSATTSASGGCGGCISPTARPASPSGASASCRCTWPSLDGANTPASRRRVRRRWRSRPSDHGRG